MKRVLVLMLALSTQIAWASETPEPSRAPAVLDAQDVEEAGGHFGLELRQVPRRQEVSDKGRFNCEEPWQDDAHHLDSASAGGASPE